MSDPANLSPDNFAEWLQYANGDLRVAEIALTDPLPAYHTICFLCQSAAEKFLKAYLLSKGWALRKTHDLVELIDQCATYDIELGDMIEEAAGLNEFIIAGRYPGDFSIEKLNAVEAEKALQAVRRIRDRVNALLSNSSN
jgi:HEPN domain-containing protein